MLALSDDTSSESHTATEVKMERKNNTSASLHIGDIVSIYAEGVCSGFLSTLGLLDDRCLVNSGARYPHQPPRNFSDCCFKVCATNGCSVLDLSVVGGNEPDAASAFKNQAITDCCPEGNTGHGSEGKLVEYGQEIRLLHTRSDRFLTLKESVLQLALHADGDSCFTIEPSTESRGGVVLAGDSVLLSTCNATKALGVANEEVDDQPGCRQVIASSRSATSSNPSWRLSLFLDYTESVKKDVLKSGDVVRLFHEEEEKFLTLDQFEGEPYVFLRTTGRETAASAKSSKGLWEVEVVNEQPCRGGNGSWSSRFRFRHLATGQFLAVDVDRDVRIDPKEEAGAQYTLVVSDKRDANCVFMLEASETTHDEGSVPRSSSVRIRHVLTSTWIHSTAIPIDENEEKPVMTRVKCSRFEREKETFALIPASAAEIRDLDVVNSATQVLRKLVDSIKSGNFGQKEFETAIQLLPKIANFILSQEGGKSVTQAPDRDRQKLLREQGILGQLFEILQALLEKVKFGEGVADEENPESSLHEQIRRLGCEVLRLSQEEYRKNREYITDQCTLLKKRIGYYEQTEKSIAADRPSQWNILDEVFGAIGS